MTARANSERTPQQNDVQFPIPPGPPPAAAQPDLAAQVAALQAQIAAMNAQQQPAPSNAPDPAMLAAIAAAMRGGQQTIPEAAQAALNDQAFNNELNSFIAKAQLRMARQRAERPAAVMTIATDEDQMSLHVDAWRVVKYAAGAIVIMAVGVAVYLLVKEGVKWVATQIHAPAAI